MKKLIITSILFAIGTGFAVADTTATNNTNAAAGSSALSGSSSGVNSAIRGQSVGVGTAAGDVSSTQGQSTNLSLSNPGATTTIDSHAVSHAADLSNAVGTAFAPALTTTLTETCMGSTSVGAGFAGGAFSFGTTWRDTACVRRLDAREIKSFGDVQAAKEIMCDSDLVKAAFKRVGRPCVEDGGSVIAVADQQPVSAPVPVPEPTPYTEKRVKDEQDLKAKKDADILRKADESREVIRLKYGF